MFGGDTTDEEMNQILSVLENEWKAKEMSEKGIVRVVMAMVMMMVLCSEIEVRG